MVVDQKSKISAIILTAKKYSDSKNIATIVISIVEIMGIALSTYGFQTSCQNDEP